MPHVGLGLMLGAGAKAASLDPDAPIQILNPVAWWRADNVHLTSGAVDTEYDKTTNAKDATQASAPLQPAYTASNAAFNNQPTVDDATASYLASPNIDLTAGYTVVVVHYFASGPTRNPIIKHDTSVSGLGARGFIIYRTSSDALVWAAADASTWVAQTANGYCDTGGVPHVYSFLNDGTAGHVKIRKDGVDSGVTVGSTNLPDAAKACFLLAGFFTDLGDGSQAEVILFSPALSTLQVATVEAVLKTRYGTP